ncbi:unnamed protein product, partial [Polarella glacialis]
MATQVEQMAKMADLAGMRGKSSVQGSQEMMKQRSAISKKLRQQRLRREVQCACHLRQKLDSWSLDPPDDVRFDAWRDARLEASSLARSQHGPELLIALGKAYRLQSQISLASQRAEPVSWTKKAVALTRRGILKWRYRGSFLQTLAGSLPCLKKVFDMAPKGTKAAELTDEQKQQIAKAAMDEALPRFLLIAWSLVIQDVNCTAQAVAKLLLSDTSVAAEVRRHRARALGRLGKIFLEEGLHARGSGDAEKQGDAQTKLREALAGSVRSKGSSQPATRASQTAQATRRSTWLKARTKDSTPPAGHATCRVPCTATMMIGRTVPAAIDSWLEDDFSAREQLGNTLSSLSADGSVVTWGLADYGGNSSAVAPLLTGGVVQVCGTCGAFAAIKANGSVVTWGDADYGGNSSAVAPFLTDGVVQICGTDCAFAAIKADGSVVTWGGRYYGGSSSAVAPRLTDGVVQVCGTCGAFAAIKADGSLVTWGGSDYGGNSSAVAPLLTDGVVQVCGTSGAFAAIKADGSVVTWGMAECGGNSSAVAPLLPDGVVQICGTKRAFAAIKADGSVVTWGGSDYGGNSAAVAPLLTEGVVQVRGNNSAFAAIKADGSVISDLGRFRLQHINYNAAHHIKQGLAQRTESAWRNAEIIQKLENLKKRKELGEKVSPAVVKEIAVQVKPLLPEMSLEQLVKTLRLFTSARYEDHDLYLRILGEIPVQVRGIAPEMLTTCLRVLWRLRLHEETYVELFSMEAMNMIRAARRPTTRAPRRPPAPSRLVDAAATAAAASGAMPSPVAPPAPSQPEVCAPFNASQLVHIGNALSQLGAKYLARFMEVFQEQLAIAIPQLTQEECELVSPALATSQLMHDPLRRAFLERCAQVDAGAKMPTGGGSAAPDIASYQQEAGDRRRRLKNFRNIFVFEASVRKETFSFFTSLPAEVRTYLDRVHADAAALSHEGTGTLSAQDSLRVQRRGCLLCPSAGRQRCSSTANNCHQAATQAAPEAGNSAGAHQRVGMAALERVTRLELCFHRSGINVAPENLRWFMSECYHVRICGPYWNCSVLVNSASFDPYFSLLAGDKRWEALQLQIRAAQVTRSFVFAHRRLDGLAALSLTQYLRDDCDARFADLSFLARWEEASLAAAGALHRGLRSLRSLTLDGNDLANPEMFESWCAALEEHPGLQHISLRETNLKDDAAFSLARVLKENCVLFSLDLSSNRISDSGVEALTESLSENLVLLELGVEGTDSGESARAELSKVLERNRGSYSGRGDVLELIRNSRRARAEAVTAEVQLSKSIAESPSKSVSSAASRSRLDAFALQAAASDLARGASFFLRPEDEEEEARTRKMPSAAEIAADGVWFDAGDGRDLLKELTLRLEAGWRYTAADQEEMLMLRERAVGMKAVRVLERERAEEASKRIAAEQYEFRQSATPTEQRIQELREALADHAEDMRPVRHKQLQLMLDRRAAQDELLLEREEFGHAALNVQRLESALKMKHWETCEKAEQLQQGVAEAEAATEQLEKDN